MKINFHVLAVACIIVAAIGIIITHGEANAVSYAAATPLGLFCVGLTGVALYNGGKALWRRITGK